MRTAVNPDFDRFVELLERVLKKGHFGVIFCNCEVSYKGRAVSKLPSGDRVVFIKPDKSIFVHKPDGRNPVNWMPENSNIKIRSDSSVRLICSSINPREIMEVVVNNVYIFSSSPMKDSASINLVGSESDMAQLIYNNPALVSSDFIPASMEEQTKYGFVDVFGSDRTGNIIVIECKRYKAQLNSVQQLRRYVERIKESKGVNNVRGIIAAPDITVNARKMLEDWGFSFVKVEPPLYLTPDKELQKNLGDF